MQIKRAPLVLPASVGVAPYCAFTTSWRRAKMTPLDADNTAAATKGAETGALPAV